MAKVGCTAAIPRWTPRAGAWFLACLTVGLVLLDGHGVAAPAPMPVPSSGWRSAANAGKNLLFCYLYAVGATKDYPSFSRRYDDLSGTNRETATGLVRAAREFGVDLQPATLTMNELKKQPLPLIVHVDGLSPEEGTFLLVLSMRDDMILHLSGPTVSVNEFSRADFRRIWGGYALLPATENRRGGIMAFVGLALGLAGVFAARRFGRAGKGAASPPGAGSRGGLAAASMVVAGLGLFGGVPRTGAAELPEEIARSLREQAAALAVVSLSYTEKLSGPGVPEFYEKPITCTASFQSNRFYVQAQIPQKARPPLVKARVMPYEAAFDGRIFYDGRPEAGHILQKFLPEDPTDPRRSVQTIMLYGLDALGLCVPQVIADLPDYPGPRPLALELAALDSGARIEQTPAGVRLTVEVPDKVLLARQAGYSYYMESYKHAHNPPEWIAARMAALDRMQAMKPRRQVSLTLDPAKGYAITERVDKTMAGDQILVVKNEDWKLHEPAKVWLPGRSTQSYYSPSREDLSVFFETPRLVATYEVQSVAFQVPPGTEFAINYTKPGAEIYDRVSEDARKAPGHELVYVVGADGKLLTGQVYSARREVTLMRFVNILGANCLILGVIYGAVRMFRARSAKASSNP